MGSSPLGRAESDMTEPLTLPSQYVRVETTGEIIVTEQTARCPMHTEVSAMTQAFEKTKSFIARSTSKETGGIAQICLSDPGFSQTFMSWGRMR